MHNGIKIFKYKVAEILAWGFKSYVLTQGFHMMLMWGKEYELIKENDSLRQRVGKLETVT